MEASRSCDCKLAGYCNRHGIHKSEKWFELCRDESYRRAWDEGAGPGQRLVEEPYYTPVDDEVNPVRRNLLVTVATGSVFSQILSASRPSLERYAERIGADFVALTGVTQKWWGLEKFRVKKFISEYDRTIYIDADVFIRKSCPNLFEVVPADKVGIHNDYPMKSAGSGWLPFYRKMLCSSQSVPIYADDLLLNSGVVICSRDHSEVWSPMPRPVPESHIDEQLWIERNIVKSFEWFPIDSRYNWQWWFRGFRAGIPSAEIIHFSNCPNEYRKDWIDLCQQKDAAALRAV